MSYKKWWKHILTVNARGPLVKSYGTTIIYDIGIITSVKLFEIIINIFP
jgi:hypothetical protein